MALLLTHLPRDILEAIVFYITELEDIDTLLRRCGDHLLMAIMRPVVKTVRFKERWLPQGAVELVQSFPLKSLFASSATGSVTAIQKILHACSKELRHLVLQGYSEALFFEQDLDERSLPLPLAVYPRTHAPWIIRESFPHLETLTIKDCVGLWADQFWQVEFMAGLPVSLTEISLPFLNSGEFNWLPLLPPRLTRIEDIAATPTTESPNLENPSYLTLRTDFSTQVPSLGLGKWSFIPNWSSLAFPASLTHLEVRGEFPNTNTLPTLPHRLLTLKINFYRRSAPIWINLQAMWANIPVSITELSLGSVSFGSPETQSNDLASLLYPALKKFSIHLRHLDSRRENADETFVALVSVMPNVEEFTLGASWSPTSGVPLDSLRLFNGQRLRSLDLPLANDCFKYGGTGPTPMEEVLPNLKYLKLQPTSDSEKDFHFGAIPPSVTDFEYHFESITTKHLRSLPKGIKRLSLSDATFDLSSAALFHLPPKRGTPEWSAHSAWDVHFDFISRYRWVDAYRSSTDGNIFLSANRCEALQRGTALSTNQREDALSLNWPKLSLEMLNDYPSLLIWGYDDFDSDSPDFDHNLPHLTRLDLQTSMIHEVPLSNFKSLTDLTLLYASCAEGSLPPNLTRLVISGGGQLDEDLSPLPNTLTELKIHHAIPKNLEGLFSLRIFENASLSRWYLGDWRSAFPASLESITMQFGDLRLKDGEEGQWTSQDISLFFEQHPSLTCLTFLESPTIEMMERFEDAKPPQVQLKFDFSKMAFNNPAHLAARAGLSHGQVFLIPTENIATCVSRIANRAFKRSLVREVNFYEDPEDLADWISFLPYLSPNTTDIILDTWNTADIEEGALVWPSSLTRFECNEFIHSFDSPFKLPPQLQILSIEKFYPGKGTLPADFLPPTLTYLKIDWEITAEISWPPHLTYLSAFLPMYDIDTAIRILPPQLKHLVFNTRMDLPIECFELLPPGLKRFSGAVAASDDEDNRSFFLEVAQKRGFIWITPHNNVNDLVQDLEGTLDVLVAINKSK